MVSTMETMRRALVVLRQKGMGEFLRRTQRRVILDLMVFLKRPLDVDSAHDPYHLTFRSFFDEVNRLPAPDVLELGSRARSGNVYRSLLVPAARYVGFDLLPGPNVDVVGDAHEVSNKFPPASFDAIFSVSLFEHLAMPWKVALEMNRLLRPGGLAFVATHPALPPHELPWDFWRFNRAAFQSLFCAPTGFSLVRCEEGLPCSIIPFSRDAALRGTSRHRAYVGVAAIARKISEADPRLSWPVSLNQIMMTPYPAD